MSSGLTSCVDVEGNRGDNAMFDGYLDGRLSAHMTLMYWLIAKPDINAIECTLNKVLRDPLSASKRKALAALAKLLRDNRDGCERIASMLRSGMDTDEPAATVGEGIDFSQRLFDWSITQCAEASVALYSLGNPHILAEATAEIVEHLAYLGVLTERCDALDIGCGSGRLEHALAPSLRSITGLDLSTKMVAAARLRCAGLPNVHFLECTGRDLALIGDDSKDLVFAVDSFPYIVQSGAGLVKAHFHEAQRVLKKDGSFIIFEYSYRGDPARDCADVASLAATAGFAVNALGETPFSLWDGKVFHLLRK